jgi:hypothetical protein
MSAHHRIDVHQHVVPPFWAIALPDHGGDPSGPRSGDPTHSVLPQWSPELAIDLMDSQEIATGILSLTAPGIVGWYKNQRPEIARRVNTPRIWSPTGRTALATSRRCRSPTSTVRCRNSRMRSIHSGPMA